jgi:CBS-domain-containing membrane protein
MGHRKVSSVMTPATEVVSVRQDDGFKEIAALLAGHRISAVPVLDAQSHVIGVVSEADLLAKESAMEPRHLPLFAGRKERVASLAKSAAATAGDLMTSPALTVGLNEDVVYAARLMQDRHDKRLPVTDEEGRLQGVVSRRDILRLFVQSDAEIRHEITEDVILGTMWVDPAGLDVTVEDGVVRLRGEVETRSVAELIGELAQRTDGVVDVANDLTYAHDDRADRPPPTGPTGIFTRRTPS